MKRITRSPVAKWGACVLVVSVVCSLAIAVERTLGGESASTVAPGPATGTVADITWGVSRAEIDRTIADTRKAGISWVRANQNWSAGEPDTKGILNQGWLADVDYAVTRAAAAGLQVLMPISDGVPYWASADPAKYVDAAGVRHWNKLWRPKNASDYASFAGAMVDRYKQLGVRTYEIWNEQNHPFFWPSGPSPSEYLALLKAAYPAIKAADPTAKVLLGGLSKNDYGYLDSLYAVGGGQYFDIVAVHPYTGAVDPTWCWNQAGSTRFAKDAFCGIEEIRRSMVANGDAGKTIWLTEFGWSTTSAAYGVSEATQASFLTAALKKVRDSYPYVTNAFWYNFRNTFYYRDDPTEIEANWGLVRTDFSAKPALAAIRSFSASVRPTTISISDSTVLGGSGGTSAAFTVSLSVPAPALGVTVMAATANGSASAGSDYTALAPTPITFSAGEMAKTVSVAVSGDSVVEGDETFVVNLSSPVGAVLADPQGLATILDPLGSPALSVGDVSVHEGRPGSTVKATFTVDLSSPTDRPVTVRAATANGSAQAGSDYAALSVTLTFAPGERTKTVDVAVIGDSVEEGDETFVVDLSAPVGAVLADAQGLATIFTPLGGVTLSLNDVSAISEATNTSINLTVSLSAATDHTVTVRAATANGSALAGSDYTALAPTTISFAPGETTKAVTVGIIGDAVAEPKESFVVNLSSAVGAVIADAQGRVTILDPLGVPAISIDDVSVIEGATGASPALATFTVSLSSPTDQAVTVKAATADGSAQAGSDYTRRALGTLGFPAGTTTRTVTVAVTGDSLVEANETFVVNLSSPVGAVLADAQGVATIRDPQGTLLLLPGPEPPPSLRVSDVTVVEGPFVSTKAIFEVRLSAPAPLLGVSVRLATSDGSALAGSDYTALSTTVAFAFGETAKSVAVAITADPIAEADETFVLNLSSPAGAVLGDSQGLATIYDALGAPTISVNDISLSEPAAGAVAGAVFTVSLSAPADRVVTVNAATADGSAVAGSDYTALRPMSVSFAVGETAKTVTVAVAGDSLIEAAETFVLKLFSPVGASLSDSQGTATLFDPREARTISIADVTVVNEKTPTSATFTVALSAPAPSPGVSVKAASADGSAVAGSDYSALGTTTISFAAGETAKTVTVAVTGDAVAEPNETFFLNLSAPLGAVLADAQGLATILDPLGAPTVSVDDIAVAEGSAGAAADGAFTVSMSAPTDRTVTVKVATANGSASAGSDYTAVVTTVSFAAGETLKVVTVTVMADPVAEPAETFFLNLSAPAGAALADAQGLATIFDSG